MKITRKISFLINVFTIPAVIVMCGSAIACQKAETPSAITDKIQISADNLLKDLKPGMTLYMHHEVYSRHGSADSEIMALDWSVPEETIRDIWLGPVDDEGYFTGFKSQIKDLDDNIWQETNASGNTKVHRDSRTGKEVTSTWEPMSVTNFLAYAGSLPSKLLDEEWGLSSKGTRDGEETVIFEKTVAFKSGSDGDSTMIDIPYTRDLSPVSILTRVEIRQDNPLLQISQNWAIDNNGKETLISQDRWTQVDLS